jgi:hypothetical protein
MMSCRAATDSLRVMSDLMSWDAFDSATTNEDESPNTDDDKKKPTVRLRVKVLVCGAVL